MNALLKREIARAVMTRQALRAGKSREEFARQQKPARPVTGRPPKRRDW